MNYDAIFQKARAMAAQRLAQGTPVSPDETVCVICAQSGRLYNGSSHVENLNGIAHNVHAEAEAIRQMQGGNEAIIQALLLLSVSSGMPLLPCEHCLRSVLSLHSDNIVCEILMPDRAVPIKELIRDADKFVRHDRAEQTASAEQGAGVLLAHVNSLLNAAEDEDEPEEEEEGGGSFFGFFKRKKKK